MNHFSNLLHLSTKFAKIIHPPRQLVPFVKSFLQKWNELSNQIQTLSAPFLASKEDSKYWFSDFVGSGARHFSDNLEQIINWLKSSQEIERIKYQLTDVIEYDNKYSLKRIPESVIRFYLPDIKFQFKIMIRDYLDEDDFNNIEFNIEDYLKHDPELKNFDYNSIQFNDYKNLKQIKDLLIDFQSTISSFEEKLNEQIRFWTRGDSEPPKRENIEILYHTTINSNDLEQNGFVKNLNAKQQGLGGSNSSKSGNPSVSFTSDFYVAKEIARSLREGIMISNGEIDENIIFNWADQDGIKEEVLNSFRNLYGRAFESETLQEIKGEWIWYPGRVFDLYKLYLWYAKPQGKNYIERYNPVYTINSESLMNSFKSKSASDVGIVCAEIDMTNPDILYLSSMHEYRVPVESILKIVKVIR